MIIETSLQKPQARYYRGRLTDTYPRTLRNDGIFQINHSVLLTVLLEGSTRVTVGSVAGQRGRQQITSFK